MDIALSSQLQMTEASNPHRRWRRQSIIPGFGLTFGFSLIWLTLIVLIPLSTIFIRSAGMGWDEFVAVGLSDRAIASSRLSIGAVAVAAAINAFFGLLIAWVLVRYEFHVKQDAQARNDL